MKLIRNTGDDRVIEVVREKAPASGQLDIVTSSLSLFAFAELAKASRLPRARLLLPKEGADLGLLGDDTDRPARNQLRGRWLARTCARWLESNVEVRRALDAVPQGALVVRDVDGQPIQSVLGSFGLSTQGLGITAGNPLSLVAGIANLLGQYGETLKAGMVLMTGSIVSALPVEKGDHVDVEFTRLGRVGARFAA